MTGQNVFSAQRRGIADEKASAAETPTEFGMFEIELTGDELHLIGLDRKLQDAAHDQLNQRMPAVGADVFSRSQCAVHGVCLCLRMNLLAVLPTHQRHLARPSGGAWFADGNVGLPNGRRFGLTDLELRLGSLAPSLVDASKWINKLIVDSQVAYGAWGALYGAPDYWSEALELSADERAALLTVREHIRRLPTDVYLDAALVVLERWARERDNYAAGRVAVGGGSYEAEAMAIPLREANDRIFPGNESANWRRRCLAALSQRATISAPQKGSGSPLLAAVVDGRGLKPLAGRGATSLLKALRKARVSEAEDVAFVRLGTDFRTSLPLAVEKEQEWLWGAAAAKEMYSREKLHEITYEELVAFLRDERPETHFSVPTLLAPAMQMLELTPTQKCLLLAILSERQTPRITTSHQELSTHLPCFGSGRGYRALTWCTKAAYSQRKGEKYYPRLRAFADDLEVLHGKLGVEARLSKNVQLDTPGVVRYLQIGAHRVDPTTQLLRIFIPKDFEASLVRAVGNLTPCDLRPPAETVAAATNFGAHEVMGVRAALGVTQKALGISLGVTGQLVSQWERGARPVSAKHRDILIELAGAAANGETTSSPS